MQIFTYIALVLTLYGFWSQIMGVVRVVYSQNGKAGTLGFWIGTVSLCVTIALGVHVGW
jgi:hypothetical protein